MGSIRPLVTITILVVVGAYLYVKINEGPVSPRSGANSGWNQAPDGVPPLSATNGASLAVESAAPAWPSTPDAATPPAAPPSVSMSTQATATSPGGAAPVSDAANNALPAVPAIPELPPLPTTTEIASPSTVQPSVPLPTELPANIPTARYPDEPGQNSGSATAHNPVTTPPAPAFPATGPATIPGPPAAPQVSASPTDSTESSTPTQNSANGTQPPAAGALGSAPAPPAGASTQNPLRSSADTGNRYATVAPATPPVPAESPTSSALPADATFADSWPAIQAALDNRDLKQAHRLLSKWQASDSLTPVDAQRVQTLLSQLAGTVIYSTEHQLEPPRVVKPGETLETIAKDYNVPWQLLAKINGVPSPDRIQPGQELKVVRGPFSAVVDLARSEVALSLEDRYAGKFRVSVPPGTTVTDGQWVVDQKLTGPANTANPNTNATTPIPADRTIILRSADANATPATPTLLIASGAPPEGQGASPPTLRISPQDAEELSDILSIGSRVTIRR